MKNIFALATVLATLGFAGVGLAQAEDGGGNGEPTRCGSGGCCGQCE